MSTLDDLTTEMKKLGYPISRSALYYHLMPKNAKTIDGRRHLTTAPVRLIRATNDLRKTHIDSNFARATINHVRELVSFLGPDQVLVVSPDDKARIALGVTAAKVQQPFLMHTEYRVRLPSATSRRWNEKI